MKQGGLIDHSGVGLDGIVAVLAGANEVTISDYPAPTVLANIKRNAAASIPHHQYRIEGHEWGELDTDFASQHKHRFTRVLAADCYWMPWQHLNLVHSMLHFLTQQPCGRVFAVGGFHTGRAKLANFFEVAVEEGLHVEEIYEEDTEGRRREWTTEGEDVERNKWLVIARLMRKPVMDH